MSRRSRYALAVSALLFAAALRLWQIDSVPPGLYFDEAGHLLSAQSIGRDGKFPVYFEWGQGNDPLLAYLAAITLAIVGPVAWAGRLAVAWVGLLSVAATIRVGLEFFPDRLVGAVAGLVLASLFWHVNLSRYGVQSILAGLLAPAAMAALWVALRTGRWRAYLALGLCVGLGLVAYIAFRVFVFLPALVLAAYSAGRPRRRRAALIGGAMAAAVSLSIFSPLAVFFAQNPQWFVDRFRATTGQTLGAGNPAAVLVANTGRVVWGLFGHGTEDQRQNIPGRPALDVIQSSLFAVGALVSLRRVRWTEVVLGLWLALGLLPSILTQDAPSFVRMIMAAPPAALLVAVGATALARWGGPGRIGLAVALIGLVFSAGLNIWAYFGQWAESPVTFKAFDGGLYWIANELRGAPAGSLLYETPVFRHWPTFEFTLGPEAYQRFNAFNGRECFVTPAVAKTDTVYAVIVAEDPLTLPALGQVFPSARQTAQLSVGGAPYAAIYSVPAGSPAQVAPARPGVALYGGLLQLLGDSLPSATVQPGGELKLELMWKLGRRTPADLKRFVHVIGPPKVDGSIVYAQVDSSPCDNAYPTWQWAPGEIMIEYIKVAIPASVPPGSYQIYTGWYDGGTRQRLPAVDAAGRPLGDTVALETVQVANAASK